MFLEKKPIYMKQKQQPDMIKNYFPKLEKNDLSRWNGLITF